MESQRRAAPEFVNIVCVVTVVLFTANNFWFKWQFGNFITGKLSDLTAAFFLPLFLSGLLHFIFGIESRRRLLWGALATIVLFLAFKSNTAASSLLDVVLSTALAVVGVTHQANIVDPLDLWALLMVPAAVWYGHRQMGGAANKKRLKGNAI